MNIFSNLKINGILRLANVLIVIGLYKYFGIDLVVLYGVINIDAHLDELADSISKIIK